MEYRQQPPALHACFWSGRIRKYKQQSPEPHLRFWSGRGRISQKILALLILVSFFLTLLLSLNFHIWSGCWEEGSLEGWVRQQEGLIGTGLATDRGAALERLNHPSARRPALLPMGLPPCPVLPGKLLIKAMFFLPVFPDLPQDATLCSLSVRMDC